MNLCLNDQNDVQLNKEDLPMLNPPFLATRVYNTIFQGTSQVSSTLEIFALASKLLYEVSSS